MGFSSTGRPGDKPKGQVADAETGPGERGQDQDGDDAPNRNDGLLVREGLEMRDLWHLRLELVQWDVPAPAEILELLGCGSMEPMVAVIGPGSV